MSFDPSNQAEDAHRYLEEAYRVQMAGNLEEAIRLYHQSIEAHPSAEAHTFLGWAYSIQHRYDDAIEECQKAIKLDPDYGNPYNDIGSYLIERGELDAAVPWLEKAAQSKRYESYYYPHFNLGRVWEKKGDWKKALRAYQDALIENKDYTLAKRALNRLFGLMN